MKKRKRRIYGFEYLYSIGMLVPVLKNKYGEVVAYQAYNEKTRKRELIKLFRND